MGLLKWWVIIFTVGTQLRIFFCPLNVFPFCNDILAIARFSEAIIDYLADEKRATESGISAMQFEGEIFSAYEHLFNIWLMSKEPRVSKERICW